MKDSKRIQTLSCYQKLHKLLVCGQVPEGQRLTEEAWTKRLGVNRAALHEAMNILAFSGLLSRGPKSGFFVPRFEKDRVNEVQKVRLSLEIGAVRLMVAKQQQAKWLTRLYKLCDSLSSRLTKLTAVFMRHLSGPEEMIGS